MEKVGVVIVNYNGEEYQNDCIESLYQMTYTNIEIIVVDSGSNDNSIGLLKEKYPKIYILEQKDNVGVAVGNNIGIRYSIKLGTSYTLLLNNDVVVEKELLEKLVRQSQGEKVVVPKIYYYHPDNMLWYAGGKIVFRKGTAIHYGIKELDHGQYNKKEKINYAPTCCMLIPNYVFDKVGFFDEKIFMYFDDTDFCLRMYKMKIELWYIPEAKMWHKVSSSSGGEDSPISVYYSTRNRFYFIKKHSEYMSYFVMLYVLLINIIQYIISPFRCKNDKYIKDAIIDYYRGNMGRKDDW